MKIIALFRVLRQLNLNTIIFNFHYFKFRDAIRFPVLVSRQFHFVEKGGRVTISAPIGFGMITIGYGHVGIFDKQRSRTLWECSGHVIFRGNATLWHGSKISVGRDGTLDIGPGHIMSAEACYVVHHHVKIGGDVGASWEVLVMDTDFHPITDADGKVINPPEEIFIGDHVWIGCRSLILKGSRIPDSSVIAAGTIVTGKLPSGNTIYAGVPARAVRSGVQWKLEPIKVLSDC